MYLVSFDFYSPSKCGVISAAPCSNIKTRSCNYFCSGKAISITHCECVCSLSYAACNAHAPYWHLDLPRSTKFFHVDLITGRIFGGEGGELLNTKCLFLFPPQLLFGARDGVVVKALHYKPADFLRRARWKAYQKAQWCERIAKLLGGRLKYRHTSTGVMEVQLHLSNTMRQWPPGLRLLQANVTYRGNSIHIHDPSTRADCWM